jgi:hypothetical protein
MTYRRNYRDDRCTRRREEGELTMAWRIAVTVHQRRCGRARRATRWASARIRSFSDARAVKAALARHNGAACHYKIVRV